MTKSEYAKYYTEFIATTLKSAIEREANIDTKLRGNPALRSDLENKKNGLIVLALVAFIESNFLSKPDLRLLRSYQLPTASLPASINPIHLSSFIYLRDCFAHNPSGVLLSPGTNTTSFCSAVSNGGFPWAQINGQSVIIDPAGFHELHLQVLRFFGENV